LRVIEFYKKSAPVFSFEFFLPKTTEDLEVFKSTLKELKNIQPHFVTMTYGAGGSSRERTFEIVDLIRNQFGFETVMHLTCITHTKAEVESILNKARALHIENIMALRGDTPKEGQVLVLDQRDYRYARDLVAHLKALGGFCLGVAGYPEGHPECSSKEEDLKHLKEKVEAGADWVTTQLFFDNKDYFDFVARARAAGVTIPIVPGIMPITGFKQLKKFTAMCGSRLPDKINQALEPIQEDRDAVIHYGIEYATKQCEELLAGGAPGIHFYTLNKSHATQEILSRLKKTIPSGNPGRF